MAKSKHERWITEKGLELIKGWARNGLFDKQIAKNMGISKATFYEWKKKYPQITEVLEQEKEVADQEVQNALHKKAKGFFAEEERAFKCKEVYYDDQGRRCEKEELQTVTVKVYYPPDTVAALAWMNNRQPELWRRNAGKEKLDRDKFDHEKKKDEEANW